MPSVRVTRTYDTEVAAEWGESVDDVLARGLASIQPNTPITSEVAVMLVPPTFGAGGAPDRDIVGDPGSTEDPFATNGAETLSQDAADPPPERITPQPTPEPGGTV